MNDMTTPDMIARVNANMTDLAPEKGD